MRHTLYGENLSSSITRSLLQSPSSSLSSLLLEAQFWNLVATSVFFSPEISFLWDSRLLEATCIQKVRPHLMLYFSYTSIYSPYLSLVGRIGFSNPVSVSNRRRRVLIGLGFRSPLWKKSSTPFQLWSNAESAGDSDSLQNVERLELMIKQLN